MGLILDIDIAQPDLNHLLIKDISDNTEYATAFSPDGKASVFAFYLGLMHQNELQYRYIINKRAPAGGSVLLPSSELNITNAGFYSMDEKLSLTKYDIEKPSGVTLPVEYADGIYRLKYGVGPNPGNLNIVANNVYYTINGSTIDGVTVPANSVLSAKQNASFASGAEFFKPTYEMTSVLMVSAKIKVAYAKAVISYVQAKNKAAKEQARQMLQEFRSKFDACKALVINDNFTEAALLFTDCEDTLNTVNAIV
jgi:hypothetical protein